MNLHKATTLLLLGLAYSILHKAVFALVSTQDMVAYATDIASILWIIATSFLILFVYFFLKEISPLDLQIRFSLLTVMICTGIIILDRIFFTLSLDSVYPNEWVLDAGCGTGNYSVALAQAGYCVIGTDFTAGMLAKA
ncbi:MAG: class I SAM-dependent methyltransferase [bacterium]